MKNGSPAEKQHQRHVPQRRRDGDGRSDPQHRRHDEPMPARAGATANDRTISSSTISADDAEHDQPRLAAVPELQIGETDAPPLVERSVDELAGLASSDIRPGIPRPAPARRRTAGAASSARRAAALTRPAADRGGRQAPRRAPTDRSPASRPYCACRERRQRIRGASSSVAAAAGGSAAARRRARRSSARHRTRQRRAACRATDRRRAMIRPGAVAALAIRRAAG